MRENQSKFWKAAKETGKGLLKAVLWLAVVVGAVALLGIFRLRSANTDSTAAMIAGVEDRLEEKIQSLDYEIDELRSEIENDLADLRSAQDAEKYEREDETERIREKLWDIKAALDETAGTTEYILELIGEYHPE